MDKSRLIMALALSLVVLMSWPLIMRYLAPQSIEEPPPIEAIEPSVNTPNIPKPPVTASKPPATASTKTTPAVQPASTPQTTQAAQREITISSDYWSATFSNRGAVATSWKLSKFQENGRLREIKGADNAELQLIPQQIPEPLSAPLSLRTPSSPEIAGQLSGVNFEIKGVGPSESNIQLGNDEQRQITFEYVSPSLTATKTFTFRGNQFVFDVEAEVTSTGGKQPVEIVLGPRFGDQSDTQTGSYSTPPTMIAYTRDGQRQQVPGARVTPPFATITAVDHDSRQIELDKPLGEVGEIKVVAEKGTQLVGFAKVLSREANGQRLTLDALPAGISKGHGVAQGTDTLRHLYSWAGVSDHYFVM